MGDDKLLDGARVAAEMQAEVAATVAELARVGVQPRLDAVLVGDDPASAVYVGAKAKACAKLGMVSETHRLEQNAGQAELEALVDRLNSDPDVDGVLVQLPLPAHLDTRAILDRVDPSKDVDGFHPFNVGLLVQGRPRFVACTPVGIMELLRREGIEVKGRRAVVVGRSDIVGKPMALLLLHAHATVTVCHSRTRDLAGVTREAELLVVASGQQGLVGADHVGVGAVVIDVGIHRLSDRDAVARLYPGNARRLETLDKRGAVLVGDVDFEAAAAKASRITPVPGGVGPLTIAALMANTARAARMRRDLSERR